MPPFLMGITIAAVSYTHLGIALMATAAVIEGIYADSFVSVLLAAIVLGIINAVIRPIFMVLTLPVNVVTLGLFTFVINGLMLKLTKMCIRDRPYIILRDTDDVLSQLEKELVRLNGLVDQTLSDLDGTNAILMKRMDTLSQYTDACLLYTS